MANGQYTNAAIEIEGQRLLQAESIEAHFQSGAIEQNTLALGLAGMSPGAGKVTVKVTSAVPTDGFEYDPTQALLALGTVSFNVLACGTNNRYSRVAQGRGTITEAMFKKGTNQNSSIDFTIVAPLAGWQTL